MSVSSTGAGEPVLHNTAFFRAVTHVQCKDSDPAMLEYGGSSSGPRDTNVNTAGDNFASSPGARAGHDQVWDGSVRPKVHGQCQWGAAQLCHTLLLVTSLVMSANPTRITGVKGSGACARL